jgi:hypothetical protein
MDGDEGWVGRQIWRTDGVACATTASEMVVLFGCEGHRMEKFQVAELQSAHPVLVCIPRVARLAARAVQMKISAKELGAWGPGRKICFLSFLFLKYFCKTKIKN